MRIKLIAVDMDGTALRSDHTFSHKTLRAFREAAAAGVYIVPTTGRVRSMLPPQPECVRYAVVSNGAVVLDLKTGEIVYKNVFAAEQVRRLYTLICQYHCYLEIYHNGQLVADRRLYDELETFHVPHDEAQATRRLVIWRDLQQEISAPGYEVEKLNLLFKCDEDFTRARSAFGAMPEVSVSSGSKNALEINTAAACKWDGLSALCRRLNIAASDTMCIGDSNNDLSMIKNAGIAVAMKNADPSLIPFADYITDSNDRDGVAKAIEHFLLEKG